MDAWGWLIAALTTVGAITLEYFTGLVSKFLSFMQSVFSTFPKVIRFIIFFFMIIVLGSYILPVIIQITGTQCLNNERYDAPFYNVWSNLEYTIFRLPEVSNFSVINGTMFVEPQCLVSLNQSGGVISYYNGAGCDVCDVINKDSPSYYNSGGVTNNNLCVGSAYRNNMTGFKRWLLMDSGCNINLGGSYGLCEPPKDFFYDDSIGLYRCLNFTACGNYSAISQAQQKFLDAGFVKYQKSKHSTDDVVGVKCDGTQPKFVFFGIDIFNPLLWVFIVLIGVLLWVWKFRK